MIGKADGQHLTQAAFVRSGKIGVRLDTIDGHDDVGIKRGAIKRNRNARSGCANQTYIFSGDDRRSGRFFRDAQVSQHLLLPCGCAAAVTAHGRHDEGRQTSLQATQATVDRTIGTMSRMPRLPTPMATRAATQG